MPPGSAMPEHFDAQVIAAFGRHMRVRDDTGACFEARPVGRKLDAVCGDRVRCRHDLAHGEVHVLEALPRSSALLRSSARGDPEPIVANVTLIAVVVAPKPAPDLFIVDRYLCAAASAEVAGIVVLNKTDLTGVEALRTALVPLLRAGYETLECEAATGRGVDALARRLIDHTSVLVGQSGVGKSSIVGRLVPLAQIATRALDRGDEGRHTTTASCLYDLPSGGCLIDSPGVRDFAPAIDQLEPRSLGFVDVDRLGTNCRFVDCSHISEPSCTVRAAVEAGDLPAQRYESYRRMRRLYESLQEARGPGSRRSNRPRRH